MKTKTITTYSFSELTREAKQKAIDKFRDINVSDSYWYEPIYEGWIERLTKFGYENIEIHFSGFSSQGNGANFTGKVDICKWIESNKQKGKYPNLYKMSKEYELSVKLERDSNMYEHEMTVSASNNAGDYNYESGTIADKALIEADTLQDFILEEAREYMRQIYKDLQDYYFELKEDEIVIDTIEANDYDFTKDGKRNIYL